MIIPLHCKFNRLFGINFAMASFPGFVSSYSSSSGNSTPHDLSPHPPDLNPTTSNSCNAVHWNAPSVHSATANITSLPKENISISLPRTAPSIPLLNIQQLSLSAKPSHHTPAVRGLKSEGKSCNEMNMPEHPFRRQLNNFFETKYKDAFLNKKLHSSDLPNGIFEDSFFSPIFDALMETIIKCGIKVLACDFDLTMTTKHSGGSINPQIDRLGILSSLSQQFNQFATYAQKKGLHLVVVTFSDGHLLDDEPDEIAGKELVDAVMKSCGATFTVEKVYGYFPPNWRNSDKFESIGLSEPMADSKSFHLSRVLQEFDVKHQEVLLVDDDLANCKAAVNEGFLSINVFGGHGFEFCNIKAV
ncbi:rhoptry protein ROP9 [Cardiosporidium cionae]|uniref:Rhoptry protein ROP9 n=1 Tax=Cardiosporidium cionae TaxID=476202 RepID=A0ABQ7J6B7_9APIC|nr:rhoptry protein ROP9 [Cardiosporidium cionae]|eukprot:KAF8819519.1 rhoptry protein ROP9 [Cardiosporidium cionae]